MSQALLWSGVVIELAILAGLVHRQRLRYCYSLPAFIAVVLLSTLAMGLCPSCNTWSFWNTQELVHALLLLVMGVELSTRLFRYLPEARLWARVSLVVVVAGAAALLATAPSWRPLSVELLPRVLTALAWLYAGLVGVTAAYGLPLERLHQAILWGLSPYLILSALTLSRIASDKTLANVLNPLAFAIALAWLAWAAWAPSEPADADAETVKVVWPWRS